MPRPTATQVEQDLIGLTPAQQSQYMDELEKQFPVAMAPPEVTQQQRLDEPAPGFLSSLLAGSSPYAAAPVMGASRGQPEALQAPIALQTGVGMVGAAGGVLPAAAGLARGAAGAVVGEEVGRRAGGLIGAPHAGAIIGEVVGGGLATFKPKTLLSLIRGGRMGLMEALAGKAAPEINGAASVAREAALARKLALEEAKLAERTAGRTAATEMGARRAAIQEERNRLMAARLEARGSRAIPKPAEPAATQPHAFKPMEEADAVQETIVQQLQQQMGTTSGRREVNALIAKMKPAEANRVLGLLARGQSKPATVLKPLFGTAEPTGHVGDLQKIRAATEDLAKMLGQ